MAWHGLALIIISVIKTVGAIPARFFICCPTSVAVLHGNDGVAAEKH